MGTRAERALSTPRKAGAWSSRVAWSALSLLGAVVLIAARLLPPSASGLGTHLALGLPPCSFLVWSGLPCPTCGLTTAFSYAARFELAHSLRAHPLGLPLFTLVLLLVAYALRALVRGTAVGHAVERLQADRAAQWLVLGLLVCWVARVVALTR